MIIVWLVQFQAWQIIWVLFYYFWGTKNYQTFNFITNRTRNKLIMLICVDAFKLHNMVMDDKNFDRLGRIVWITRFFLCSRNFFVGHHIMRLDEYIFSLGFTYKQCRSPDVLISVSYIDAKPKLIEMVLPTKNKFSDTPLTDWMASKYKQLFNYKILRNGWPINGLFILPKKIKTCVS